ncbi:TetR/AcrR family transcriptional regulator [Actinomyces sp. 2119]|uniref:TetR/AcrR family transcriptional regulator n=1 Tax=Actinomyces lilanjuaniae TaxID=2321394 RepID=A0ABM6Z3Z2_9ACTO|nr:MULTISPECIES: TetR/AcrR family transcriptional regulator [Actinomyces]AYD89857.1 TetR/AcrR family transcriptional regulator [Actinomyces lilanjuaniae]RJF44847.1 TetR/AcrR family transcriptional regulator [Actinomyces sp. 2119]
MKQSRRALIMERALEITHEEGFDALTFEALAERVGVTRGGVVYHFPTKDDLAAGIASMLLEHWQAAARLALGKPLGQASQAERLQALARSILEGEIQRGELSFVMSPVSRAAQLAAAWDTLYSEWVGDVSTLTPIQRVGLLAVDGWWLSRADDSPGVDLQDEETMSLIIRMVAGEGL